MARPIPLGRARTSWADRWYGIRDRLLASPSFQRRAAAFPLTRPIARRRARALFDLTAGFVYSQILLACVRLDLFEILAGQASTAEELAGRLGLEREPTRRLLEGASALRLVASRGDGRYGLGDLGAAFLGNPGARAMVEHHALLYADLADPVALLRGRDCATGLAGYWPYAGTDDPGRLEAEQVAAYSRLMSISQAMVASEILDAVPLHRHRRLLDVGGGDGTFLEAVAARAPDLDLILFDLPAVAERARARFRDTALEHRACAVGGDFLRDPLPPGADVVSLVRVLHDHDDDRVLRVLRNVRDALPENGTLLLAEPMAGAPAAETVGAYFAFYLLAMGRGQPRTPDQLTRLLHHAGFARCRPVATRMPLLVQVMTARRV